MENITSQTSDYSEGSSDDYNEVEGLCNLDLNPMEVITQTYIHCIICALGLIGNTLVIVTYIRYKRSKTMTDVYLYNLAVADLLFVAALPFLIYNEQHGWLMGSAACKTLRAAYSINFYSGMLLLVCVSGDRYVAIVRARRSFGARSCTLLYSCLICSAVWVFAVALTVPTLIYSKYHEARCELSFTEAGTAKLVKVAVPSLQIAIGFLLPLLVMVFCYTSIVCTLLRTKSSHRHKAIRVVMAVVAAFVVCHLPYNVTLLNQAVSLFKERSCESEQIRIRVLAVSKSIAYFHCCLNPVLYAFVGVKFRTHFRQIMSDLWCFSKKNGSTTRSPRITSDTCISGRVSLDSSNNMRSFSA